MPDWAKYIEQFGALVIVAWLIFWIFKKMLPEMAKHHENQLQSQRDDLLKALGAQADLFREELQKERDVAIEQGKLFREEMVQARNVIADLAATIRKMNITIIHHHAKMIGMGVDKIPSVDELTELLVSRVKE